MKKKIFQFLRLFLATAIFFAVLMLWIDYFKASHRTTSDEFYGTLAASSLFFIIGALLLWRYFRNRSKRLPVADAYHSPFYERFKGLVQLFEGNSIQGFGTKYFLFSNQDQDGSVAATNWLILATFPIVPLYRRRIKADKEQHKFRLFYSVTSMRFEEIGPELLSRRSNRLVYAFHYGFFIPMIIAPIVLFIICHEYLNTVFPGKSFWFLILAWFAWGIGMMWISELFHKRWFLRSKFTAPAAS